MTYRLKHKTIGFGICPETKQPTKGIEGKFFIPAYQRGFRWNVDDVTRLLDDILESNGKPYSLQPIVVKPRSDDEWELIDGQQRLTSLWLILNYMKKGEIRYSLEYKTRPGSQAYLQTLDADQAKENIDYFHLHQANVAIANWFENKLGIAYRQFLIDEIFRFLSTSVRVIWYETPDNIESIPLFTRLNRGRIPLTDAELIKAVLLSEVSSDKEYAGREKEVAAQWDGIERDLQRDEIWAFVAGHGNTDKEGNFSTRISLLLDTLANKPTIGIPPRYYTFDSLRGEVESQCIQFWEKVVALHAQILGWFEEPKLHNKIGFLVVSGRSFGEVHQLASKQNKRMFEKLLVTEIKNVLKVKSSDLNDVLRYDNAKHRYPILLNLLLLFNVETCRERFPFEKHVRKDWSLEHIHAQNAQSLTKAEEWKTWLEIHLNALKTIKNSENETVIDILIQDIVAKLPHVDTPRFGVTFNTLSSRVQKALKPKGIADEPDHTISNLALLSHGDNAALGNAVFEVKRQMVLKLDRAGEYIPVCTRNVFLKYYAGADAVQPHFWGEADKNSYLGEIKEKLVNYLT